MTTLNASLHRGSRHERWLIAAAQTNDRHATEELIRRYEPLVYATATRRPVPPHGREREDLAQVARSGLWRAIRTWRPERGPFPAYASVCVRNSVTNEITAANVKCQHILNTALSIDSPPVQWAQHVRSPRQRSLGPRTGAQHAGPFADPFADPAVIVLQRERLAAIPGRLTAREQRLLAGTLNGKTQQQIAAEEHTSWRAINCAVTRLRAKLAAV